MRQRRVASVSLALSMTTPPWIQRWPNCACIHAVDRYRTPSAPAAYPAPTTQATINRIFSASLPGVDDPVKVLLHGTNFQLKVWEALLRIPSGSVTTYGALSDAVGHPGASRAVGNAVGHNPVAYLIPCHRVLRVSGQIGGYRWGALRKRAILAMEAAQHSTRG